MALDQLSSRHAARDESSARAVILAGGLGTRLQPYTSILPKPLMPIGERSILEIVIEQLSNFGITDVTLCVGYLSHLIRAVLDHRLDGSQAIRYVQERGALGTAGPLRLVEGLDDTFIVMNGDILTTLDFESLLRYHREHENAITIATRDRQIKIDYGVLHLESQGDDARIQRFEEKPEVISTVSMGIYVIEPRVLDLIPARGRFDFPDLVQRLLRAREPVGAYRCDGLWFDIGRQEDYEEAVQVWEASRGNLGLNGGGRNGSGLNGLNGLNGSIAKRARLEPTVVDEAGSFIEAVAPRNVRRPAANPRGRFDSDLERLNADWWAKQLGQPVTACRRPTKRSVSGRPAT